MATQDPGPSVEQHRPSVEQPRAARFAQVFRRMSWNGVLRRYFLMGEAIERARDGHFKQADTGFCEYLSAKRCLQAGLSLEPDIWAKLEGIAILRVALPFALVAWQSRQGLHANGGGFPRLWTEFVDHPDGRRLVVPLSARALELVQDFANASDMLYVASLGQQERAILGKSLFALTSELVKWLAQETRSVRRLKALRLCRQVFTPLAAVALVSAGCFWLTRPINYALKKPVQLSSSFMPDAYPAQALVNGDTKTLGIHTMPTESPWAQIDLGVVRKIRRVVVFNRENLPSNSVPLQIDTSVDGKKYARFAGKESEFLEWDAKGRPRRARYVRLTVPRLSSLQLNEVEVY
jgi:hypothetical protein